MKTYNLQLTDEILKVISDALGEVPTKLGMPVINEINRQILAQLPPPKPDATANSGAPMNSHSDHPL